MATNERWTEAVQMCGHLLEMDVAGCEQQRERDPGLREGKKGEGQWLHVHHGVCLVIY